MDVLPGPRRPRFPHVEIPYLCGKAPFPKEDKFNRLRYHEFWQWKLYQLETELFMRRLWNWLRRKQKQPTEPGESETPPQDFFVVIERFSPSFYGLQPRKLFERSFEPVDLSVTELRKIYGLPRASFVFRPQPFLKLADRMRVFKLESHQKQGNPGAEKQYDGLGFSGFPERQGWDIGSLDHEYDSEQYQSFFRQKPPEDTAIFIQSWLFFGTLSQLLGVFVRPEDFVTVNEDGLEILTLQSLLFDTSWSEWPSHSLGKDPPEDFRVRKTFEICYCFSQISKFTRLEDRGFLDDIPFIHELALSVRILGSLFLNQLGMDQNTLESKMGVGMALRSRFLPPPDAATMDYRRYKWCINDLYRVENYFSAPTLYYISSMQPPPARIFQNHSTCKPNACFVNSIDEETYEPRHLALCDTRCNMVGPPPDQIRDIIRRGGIPLIRFRDNHPSQGLFTNLRDIKSILQFEIFQDNLRCQWYKSINPGKPCYASHHHECDPSILTATFPGIEVIEYDGTASYVAISHVWSDGLGNVKDNTLPCCRIPFIRRALWQTRAPIKVYPPMGKNTPLSDKIAYPFMLSEEEMTPLSQEPIPLFWLDTFCVPREPELKREAIQRMGDIFRSAEKVLVLDGTLSGSCIGSNGSSWPILTHSYEETLAGILISPWMTRIWTLQEAILARKILIQFDEGPVELENIVQGALQGIRALHPGFIVTEEIVNAIRRILQLSEREMGAERTRAIWNAAVARIASKPGDELVCLASALEMDLGILLSAPEDQRPQRFYSMLLAVPEIILFNQAPKLQEIGYRWADATPCKSPFGEVKKYGAIQHDPPGLIVSCPGYVIALDVSMLSHSRLFFCVASSGLWLEVKIVQNFPRRPNPERNVISMLVEDELEYTATWARLRGTSNGVIVSYTSPIVVGQTPSCVIEAYARISAARPGTQAALDLEGGIPSSYEIQVPGSENLVIEPWSAIRVGDETLWRLS